MPSGIPDFHRLGDPEAEVLLDAQAMRALMSHAPGWVYGALVLHRLKVLSSIAAQTRRSSAEHQPGRGKWTWPGRLTTAWESSLLRS
jgi:hypothetical protein